MQHRCLIVMLFFSLAMGYQSSAQQAPSTGPTSGDDAAPSTPQVAPDAAVITIDGLCHKNAASDAKPEITPGPPGPAAFGLPTAAAGTDGDCKTVITRAQFEGLTKALRPQMSNDLKMQVATYYPQMLLSAQRIKELGLDQDPVFETKLGFGYLQVLHKAFTDYEQEKARDISDADVEKYYKEHPESFEQVNLWRILVPSWKRHNSKPASVVPGATSADSAMKLEAQKIRREAVAGGDFEKLQEKAFSVAGDDAATPEVELGKVTRAEIPAPYHNVIFGMRPGQVSEPLPCPEGWFIFKVRSKSVIPVSDAKGLIQKIRTKEVLDALKNSIHPQLNQAYFNNAASGDAKSGEGPSR